MKTARLKLLNRTDISQNNNILRLPFILTKAIIFKWFVMPLSRPITSIFLRNKHDTGINLVTMSAIPVHQIKLTFLIVFIISLVPYIERTHRHIFILSPSVFIIFYLWMWPNVFIVRIQFYIIIFTKLGCISVFVL